MKKKLHLEKWALIVVVCLFISFLLPLPFSASSAPLNLEFTAKSDTGKASIDKQFNIVLSPTAELTDSYAIDISNIDLGPEETVSAFFTIYSDNVVKFSVDTTKKKITLQFLPAAEGAHEFNSVVERNEYLNDKLTTYNANLKNKQ